MTMSGPRGVVASFALLLPGTKIIKSTISSKHRKAQFSFGATGVATGFQCALVKKPIKRHQKTPKPSFTSCRSPKAYSHLKKKGKYTFEVRALNAAGASPKPATKSFTIA
jgi:hypothetical protein